MRNSRTFLLSFALLSALVCCGTTKKTEPLKAVEQVTGQTAVKQGEQMKKQINEIEELQQTRENALEEIQ